MSKISRRKFISTAGATAASAMILHGCTTSTQTTQTPASPEATPASPTGTPGPVAAGDAPEVTTASWDSLL